MNLLIDTNIIVDILQKRQPWFPDSYSVVASCIQGKHNGYVTAHSLSDLFFILRKSHNVTARKNTVILLCNHFTVFTEDRQAYLFVANNILLPDLEDGLQIYCAENCSLDYIITRNIQDFQQSKVPAVTAHDFLATNP